jgi:diaminohydroxyphosphoribosylaminopyrimidine deaminase / 5-amino-6-(5-phosphoribosylamino)uracil reductase
MTDRTDEDWMEMAIDYAGQRVGLTGDNPAVGCVIVRAGELVAVAVTAEGGRPHAEEQALAAAGPAAEGATAYVTLEPCGARTSGAASCADLLVRAKVARVVIACLDASPFASGQGTERLIAAGIPVDSGILAEDAADLYEDYPHSG